MLERTQDEPAEQTANPQVRQSLVALHNATSAGKHFTYFENVNLSIDRTGLHVLIAPASISRKCLLLALAARFKLSSGVLAVGNGGPLTSLSKNISVGCIDNIGQLEPEATIQQIVTEYFNWYAPWFKSKRKITDEQVQQFLAPTFGVINPPDPQSYIGQLDDKDLYLLKVALAEIQPKNLVVLGDIDQIRDEQHRIYVLSRLVELSQGRVIITAASNETNFQDENLHQQKVDLFPQKTQ